MLNGGIIMRGRGVLAVSMRELSRLSVTGLSLSLIMAWPIMGAGHGGGGQRVAMSLAVRVDVAATMVAGAMPEGTFH
ncbi:hypothetical protein GCM10019060_37250 [Novosphingobium pokkalii]|nr:hypothetical protein GCM10019060_37250 [Novosphingobium pokkalii]